MELRGNPHLQEPIPAPETEEKSDSSWTEDKNIHHVTPHCCTAQKIPRNYCSQGQGAERRRWKDLPPANAA